MREGSFWSRIRRIAAISALVLGCAAVEALAGETAVYLKSGWFEWEEKVQGRDFVKEEGFLHAAGITRSDELSRFTFNELLEVWGGDLDYEGHDVTGAIPVNSDTVYLGTRLEFTAGYKALLGPLVVEPFAALGHKFWVRTRSGEDWNLIYGKLGLGGEWKSGDLRFFARGGALLPLYTRNHVSLSDAGFDDVVVEPKSDLSGFAEGGVRMGKISVSVEYEAVRFSQSDEVTTRRIAGAGAVISDDHAFQPPSDSSLISLKVAYSF